MSARLPARVRRPADMVEATRWLFALLALASLVIVLPAPLSSPDATLRLAGAASVAWLALSWSAGYLRRSAPLAMDVVDSVAILVFALACPFPSAVYGLVFGALWFRALYRSSSRAVLRCSLYAGALTASLPLWPHVPGHDGGTELALVGAIPTMFLTVIVGRHLAGSVHARERAIRLEAVHASVGAQLLGLTDAVEIRRIAWATISGICAATPGLRVLQVVGDRASLRIDEAIGGFVGVPASLPPAVLARLLGGEPAAGEESAGSTAGLDAAAGTPCSWVCVPLPEVQDQPEGAWLLLGCPGSVPPGAIVAIGSLANQVTLALLSSEVHQKLTVQATLDNLTGLANRLSFTTALAAALGDESKQPTTVLLVDIDDFKDVNDQLGHAAGDELMREISARLLRAIRPDDLCARLGGDEFAILLRGTNSATAVDVARRIVTAVAVPAHLGRGLAQVGASVGVVTGTDESDLEQLIYRADVAMYAAKANGKARVQVFETGLLSGDSSQTPFKRELGVATRNGELVVHYQPVLSLPDKRCIAVEALVRWQHPERGLLYPDAFIDYAERTGAIHDIGAFVMRRACADAAAWRDTYPGSPLAVHVNVSALQLDDGRFFDDVVWCLNHFGLPPDMLVLEITETLVISSAAAINQLDALAGHGVTIAIDDFGTGYSALTTLRSLPVQIVKIDKSFVAGSTVNAEDRAVTEAVVKMAAQMGMRTIGEGVERLDQERFLESIGTDAVQGFLYSRPTNAVEFAAWLALHLAGLAPARPIGDVVIPFAPRHTA